MKLTDEQIERFSVIAERLGAFAESVHKLPDKFIDTNLILSVLVIQCLLIGVCTLFLENLIYKHLICPPILEMPK